MQGPHAAASCALWGTSALQPALKSCAPQKGRQERLAESGQTACAAMPGHPSSTWVQRAELPHQEQQRVGERARGDGARQRLPRCQRLRAAVERTGNRSGIRNVQREHQTCPAPKALCACPHPQGPTAPAPLQSHAHLYQLVERLVRRPQPLGAAVKHLHRQQPPQRHAHAVQRLVLLLTLLGPRALLQAAGPERVADQLGQRKESDNNMLL